jgi:hypothetical protein
VSSSALVEKILIYFNFEDLKKSNHLMTSSLATLYGFYGKQLIGLFCVEEGVFTLLQLSHYKC